MLTMENMQRNESNLINIKKRGIDESIVIDSPLLNLANSSNDECINSQRLEDTIILSERSNPVGIPFFKDIQPMELMHVVHSRRKFV